MELPRRVTGKITFKTRLQKVHDKDESLCERYSVKFVYCTYFTGAFDFYAP